MISKINRKKPGMANENAEKVVTPKSKAEPGRTAAMIPNGSAMITAISPAASANSTVAGMRRLMMSKTGILLI